MSLFKRNFTYNISSRNAEKSNYPKNSEVSLNMITPLEIKNTVYSTIKIKSFQMTNTIYNVTNQNNELVISDALETVTIIIPEQHYDMNTLKDYINEQLSNTKYTMTYNENIHRFCIESTSTKFNIYGSSYELLGYKKDGESTLSNTLCFTNMPFLLGIQNVYIYSDEINVDNYCQAVHRNVLKKIPMTCNFGQVLFYNENESAEHIIHNSFIDTITIKLLDENANTLDLHSTHFFLTLEFSLYSHFMNLKQITFYSNEEQEEKKNKKNKKKNKKK